MQLNIEPVVLDPETNEKINLEISKFVGIMGQSGQSCDFYEAMRNAVKSRIDIFVGKKCEYFTSAHLIYREDYPIVQPDLTILEPHQKAWTYDLPYPEGYFPYHVKGTTWDNISWTFQWNDKLGKYGRDRIFSKQDNSMVACVYMKEPESNIGYIKAILPTRDVIPLLGEPEMDYLKGIKRCLYYSDLDPDFKVPDCEDKYENPAVFQDQSVDDWF